MKLQIEENILRDLIKSDLTLYVLHPFLQLYGNDSFYKNIEKKIVTEKNINTMIEEYKKRGLIE